MYYTSAQKRRTMVITMQTIQNLSSLLQFCMHIHRQHFLHSHIQLKAVWSSLAAVSLCGSQKGEDEHNMHTQTAFALCSLI